ncbi:hypothetical protein U9M48_044429 [Paspalum notatum var. saurae]|uniref:Retrovirus-related Pol polyprotein from transposon TNT 1-94-like beta-barrel domain-containing protein n=1 Tax=Paspalum notatum var. saurae TaxID=547442 RepID=A0AAQ3UWU0_PASNO
MSDADYSSSSSAGSSHPSLIDGGEHRSSSGRQRTMVRTVREVGSAQFSQLMRTNYTDWVVMMKVMLKARGLWSIIKHGTDDKHEGQMALEALLRGVPAEYQSTLGRKKTTKLAWESLEKMRLGDDRIKKASGESMRLEGEKVEDFALRLQALVSELSALGKKMDDEEVVGKYLRAAPKRLEPVVVSMETLLHLSELTIEDVTGRLRAYRIASYPQQSRWRKVTSSYSGRRRRTLGAAAPHHCRDGGVAALSPEKTEEAAPRTSAADAVNLVIGEHSEQANLTQEGEKEPALLLARMEGEIEEDEPALLMAQACALASGAEEVLTAPLQLEESWAQVLLGAEGEQNVEAERWYLDTGVSNHMTGSRAAFAELDSTVIGTVWFGDNSVVTIASRGTILFSC